MRNLKKLLSRNQLKISDVDKKITDEHMLFISKELCCNFRDLMLRLHLRTTVNIDLSKVDDDEKRHTIFKTWKKEQGSKATYTKLIKALLKMKCREDAKYICELLKNADSVQPLLQEQSNASAASLNSRSAPLYTGKNLYRAFSACDLLIGSNCHGSFVTVTELIALSQVTEGLTTCLLFVTELHE